MNHQRRILIADPKDHTPLIVYCTACPYTKWMPLDTLALSLEWAKHVEGRQGNHESH